jgi:hypothetical protein
MPNSDAKRLNVTSGGLCDSGSASSGNMKIGENATCWLAIDCYLLMWTSLHSHGDDDDDDDDKNEREMTLHVPWIVTTEYLQYRVPYKHGLLQVYCSN